MQHWLHLRRLGPGLSQGWQVGTSGAWVGLSMGSGWIIVDTPRYTQIWVQMRRDPYLLLVICFFPAGIVEPRFDKTPFKSPEQL